MTTVNVTRGDTTIVRIITAGPQGPAGGGGGGGTDLSYDAATRTIASSTGTDAVLPVATIALAGLESAADKAKLESITVDSATLVRKYVRNTSGISIPRGAAVYQTGSSGTTITVALADASAEATAAQTLGLAQETIAHNANGFVVAVGLLDGISTAALTEGQIVWLSETAGEGTTTRPTQPAHGVVLGYCVKQSPGTSGILYVKVDNGLELEELHDVLVTGATTDQALVKASDGLWKGRTIYSSTTPAALGTAAVGTGTTLARADHVHAMPTVADVGAAASGLIGSSGLTMAAGLLGRDTGTGSIQTLTIGSGLAISGGALVVTAGGTGTVTSVGLSLPALFTVSGSPVTTSGTLAATLATQAANSIFAGPSSGAAAAPTFRALATADLPGVIQVATELTLPLNAPGSPTARDIYAVADTIRYRDSANNERLLLNATDNLANLSNTTTARSNIGAAASGAIGSSGLTMATARLLGRTTASTGAPEEITVGSGLSLSAGTLTATGGGGASFAGYAVNNWIQPVIGITANSGSGVAGTIYLYPFEVRRSITVSDLGARVNTATASSNFQLAIYASASGLPTGTPLGSTTSLSGATVGVVSSTLASTFNLTAGQIYWAAYNADATIVMNTFTATTLYTSATVGAPNLSDIAAGNNNGWLRTFTQAFGTWPDLTSATTNVLTYSATNRTALVYLKVSALL